MLSVHEFSLASGLPLGELILGVTPSTRHRILLSSYLLNLWRGPQVVRDMILADFFAASDLGATAHAADLLLVLRQFLEDFPECAFYADSMHPWPVTPI